MFLPGAKYILELLRHSRGPDGELSYKPLGG